MYQRTRKQKNKVYDYLGNIINNKSYLGLILMIIFSLLYSIVWSRFTLDRYFSLNQPVADLGNAMELIWVTTHNTFSGAEILQNILYSCGPYYLFWVQYFKNAEILLLVFQSIFLGFSAIPIYLVSRIELGNRLESILIGCSFLLYFPLSGINWFAFHFQAMFIPLFLTGYYFYKRGNVKLSILFLVMAGSVKFPFYIFILIFALIETVTLVYKWKNKQEIISFKQKLSYLIFLSTESIFFLLLGYFMIINHNTTTQIYLHTSSSSYLVYLQSSYSKFITLVLIFSPLLFLPFMSKKWLLLYFPFIFLIIYSTNSGYFFPSLFHSQYTSFIIPFLFLGLIDSLHNFPSSKTINQDSSTIPKRSVNLNEILITRRKLILTVFVLILIFAIFYQPYGPLNTFSPDNFNLVDQTQYNMTQYNYFEETVSLIPINSYVLMQNNMPELLPRQLSYNMTILNVGLTPFAPNLSIREVVNNSFPRLILGNKWINVKIDYAIGDAYTSNYFFASYPGSPSMYNFLQVLYNSSLYGIYAQEGSVILLKRGYTGSPMLYSPLCVNYSASQLCNLISNSTYRNDTINYSNISYRSLFRSNEVFYPPGIYSVTVYLKSSSNSNSDNMSLGVVKQGQSGNWKTFNITSKNFTHKNAINRISFQFTLDNFYKFLYFELYVNKWLGTITVMSLHIDEIKPL